MEKILIPMIKNVEGGKTIAEEITGVQPMTGPAPGELCLKYVDEPKVFEFGEVIHSFTEGWMIFDGEEFVTPEEFKRRFPEESISLEES